MWRRLLLHGCSANKKKLQQSPEEPSGGNTSKLSGRGGTARRSVETESALWPGTMQIRHQSKVPCQVYLKELHLTKPSQTRKTAMLPRRLKAYFTHLQEQFSACTSYADLCKVVSDTSTSILIYELPPIHPRCLYDVGTVDHNSLKYLPKGIELVYPVATEADGNCVPRAFSLLLFGDQEHHIEIRCRIVHELVTNSAKYLSLGDVEILCQLSDFYGRETDEIFQLETLEVSRPCSFMGMWQIIAAANVFQAPVLSVYPTLTDSQEPDFYKLFFDRTVVPRNPITNQTLVILWTSTREDVSMTHWAANHVVPLMPLTNCEEILIT